MSTRAIRRLLEDLRAPVERRSENDFVEQALAELERIEAAAKDIWGDQYARVSVSALAAMESIARDAP